MAEGEATDPGQAIVEASAEASATEGQPEAVLAAVAQPIEAQLEKIAVYVPSDRQSALRQAEILCNVVQYRVNAETLSLETELEFEQIQHEIVIVLSQDCDLAQDCAIRETARRSEKTLSEVDSKLLPNVLVCELTREADFFASLPVGSDIKKRVVQNKDERYHYLRAVAPECDMGTIGMAAMGADFRRHFTIPTDELYGQLDRGVARRCRLVSPFLEHLTSRFAVYLSRVALPLDHHEGSVSPRRP